MYRSNSSSRLHECEVLTLSGKFSKRKSQYVIVLQNFEASDQIDDDAFPTLMSRRYNIYVH